MGYFRQNKSFGGRDGDRGNRRTEMHKATCSECGSRCEVPFRPTGDKPVLCSDCFRRDGGSSGRKSGGRDFGRGGRDFGGDRRERQMFQAVCSECGKNCEVPFRPTGGKPVLCSECFEGSDRGRPSTGSGSSRSGGGKLESQIAVINEKLDMIIEALAPIIEMEIVDADAPETLNTSEKVEEKPMKEKNAKPEKKKKNSPTVIEEKKEKVQKDEKKSNEITAPKKTAKKPAKKAEKTKKK